MIRVTPLYFPHSRWEILEKNQGKVQGKQINGEKIKCVSKAVQNILNDNVKRFQDTCKIQALALNVDHGAVNGNVSLWYKHAHGRHLEVPNISGSLSFCFYT